ncbi:MAG: hemA 2 [Mucilaginibacter sp.]|nr:hemA 2 [Mucilaginibacter sp.]
MHTNQSINISNFFIAGINYKKTDAATRGVFAINSDQYGNILKLAPSCNIDSLFILSTCNRTEIYGFAERPAQLINLLCTQTKGDSQTFTSLAYIKQGNNAIEHLFNVGAGLDSQLLGDYEIIGQLKQAVKFSKEQNFINCFLERLFNNVLQASKTIKNETQLSGGTVSVSFAAIQYIKEHIKMDARKKILMIGTGKIGRNTCKNVVDYLNTTNITLINRSEKKAIELASELNLKYAPLSDLAKQIKSADVILAATNANEPIILKKYFENNGGKLIIDLSVPYNVEAGVGELPNITVVNVDALSKLKDEALHKREEEAPKAKKIIEQQIAGFMEWYTMRKNAPALNAIKAKLIAIYAQHPKVLANTIGFCPVMQAQRVINGIANKMRTQNRQGCQYIEAINEFMSL